MAIVRKNIVTQGLSGMLGHNIVFRQVGGRTIVSTPPEQNEKPTAKQEAQRAKFGQAVTYAKSQVSDPVAKAEYELAKNEETDTAFTLAVTDYLKPPVVQDLDVTTYKGKVADKIKVRAVDDFKVASVKVQIFKADNTLAEEGQAVQQANKVDWLYSATTAQAVITNYRVVATAKDKPSNSGTLEKKM